MSRGHAWQRACIAGDVCGRGHVWLGVMWGRGYVWYRACMTGGHVWQGACMAGGGIYGNEEFAWQGECMAGGACGAWDMCACVGMGHVWHGSMHGRGHGWQGVCMAGREHLWGAMHDGGTCMHGRGGWHVCRGDGHSTGW